MEAAAQRGHAEAQAVMGQWRLDGHGVERDPQQALHWFLRAAALGHAMAANMAGRCHEQGWGTPPDFDKAAHWYRQALKLGDLPEARYNLANLMAAGQGAQGELGGLGRVAHLTCPEPGADSDTSSGSRRGSQGTTRSQVSGRWRR